MSDKYLLKATEIAKLEATAKTHFLNENAKRLNKSLGDLTGLTGLGFHIIEVAPGHESTEFHKHHHEDECTYHTMNAVGEEALVCIVVGQRLAHDVGDYPNQKKRIYRNEGLAWDVVNHEFINNPSAGKK